jgi:N-acetylmuramoyl-L-alanine amidase
MRRSPDNQSAQGDGEAYELAGQEGHTAEEGECLHSLAEAHGFTSESLWSLSENQSLKQARRDPHALHPGDRVFIPEPRLKEVDGQSEVRHRFKRVGIPVKLRLKLHDDGKPLKNQGFEVDFGGEVLRGASDNDGVVEVFLPPGAEAGRLKIGAGAQQKVYELDLGRLAPSDGVSGVQSRLNNLGYDAGDVDGHLGPNTREALRRFQLHHGLKETGKPDADTIKKLVEAHGS